MSNPKKLRSPAAKKNSVSFGSVTTYPLAKSTPKKKTKSTRSAIKNPDPPLFIFCPNAPDSIYPAFIYDSSTPSSTMIPTALVPLSPSGCGSFNTTTESASDPAGSSSVGTTTMPSHPPNSGMLVTAVPRLESTQTFFTESGALKTGDGTQVEAQTGNMSRETTEATASKNDTKSEPNAKEKSKGKRAGGKKNTAAPGFMFSRPQGVPTLEQSGTNAVASSNDKNINSTNDVPNQKPKSSRNCCSSACTFCSLGHFSEGHHCKNTAQNRKAGTFRCKHCNRNFCREDLLLKHQMKNHKIENPKTTKPLKAGVVKKRAISKDDRHTSVQENGLLRADAADVPFDPNLNVIETVQPFGDTINVWEPVPIDGQDDVDLQCDVDDVFSDLLNTMTLATTPSNELSFKPAELVEGVRVISGCRMLADCNVEPCVTPSVESRDIHSDAKKTLQPNLQTQPNILDSLVVQQATDTPLLMPTLDEFLGECSILYQPAITTPIGTPMTTLPSPFGFTYDNRDNNGDQNNVTLHQYYDVPPSFDPGATLSGISTKCPTTAATSGNDDVSSFQTLSSDELRTLNSLSCSHIDDHTDDHTSIEGPTEVRPEYSASHVDSIPTNNVNCSGQETPLDDMLKMDIDNFQTIIENNLMYELPLPYEFVYEDNANFAEQNLPLVNLPVSCNENSVNTQLQCGQELFVSGAQYDSELADLDIDGYDWS